jgi:hypothetical protein
VTPLAAPAAAAFAAALDGVEGSPA